MEIKSTLDLARRAYRRREFTAARAFYEEVASVGGLDFLSTVRLGICLYLESRYGEACEKFIEASGLDLTQEICLASMGSVYEKLGEREKAVEVYQRRNGASPLGGVRSANLGYLALFNGDVAAAYQLLGNCLASNESSEFAPFYFPSLDVNALPDLSSATADPQISDVCTMMGLKLQEIGRFEEARSCLLRAIRLNPVNGRAYYALTHLDKTTERDSELVQRMSDLLKAKELDPVSRSLINFSLGKAYDDLGQYEVANGRFDEANQIARKTGGPFDRKGFQADLDHVIRLYSRDLFRKRKGPVSGSDIPILIVGMMRSGTTLAEQILSSHPDVQPGEEMTFWRDNGYRFLRSGSKEPSRTDSDNLIRAYLRLLKEVGQDAHRVTDKLPQNFIAVGLFHLLFPNGRVICTQRNAVDTSLSIYMTSFMHPMPFTQDREDIVFFYRQYARLIDHWRTVIRPDRFLEVQYEDLVGNREPTTRKLIEFCGLPWDDACLHPETNLRSVKTASAWQVRQPVYSTSANRRRNYEPWLGAFNELR